MKKRFLYFMKPIGMDGPIKIGCSYRPASRLIALSVWSPFPLEIVAVAPGDLALEKRVHEVFAADLLHREWFNPTPRLVRLCDALKRNVPLSSALPEVFDDNEQARAA